MCLVSRQPLAHNESKGSLPEAQIITRRHPWPAIESSQPTDYLPSDKIQPIAVIGSVSFITNFFGPNRVPSIPLRSFTLLAIRYTLLMLVLCLNIYILAHIIATQYAA